IPLFSIILVPLSLFALICPFDFPLYCAVFLAEYTIKLIHFIAEFSPILPIAKPPLFWIILSLIATIVLLLPRGFYLRFWAFFILIIFVFFPNKKLPENNFQATIYDIGQGLSVLIQTQNHSLLFDTGKENTVSSLISSLYADNVKNLDTLVLSHNDNDHDGGRNAIQAAFTPKEIFAGETNAYDFATQHCMGNTSWQLDGVDFEWLTPDTDENAAGNDKSCVLRVVVNGYALLITGDLSQQYEQKLVATYSNNLYSQALILGHHGSKTSSSSLFLDTVKPDYAIVSAAYGNSYYHPHPSVLKRLNARHIAIYRTDYQGALRLNTLSGSLKIEPVKTYRFYWQQKPIVVPE
ncbi:MAG: ComEC family DNA internalization-related competence protein, partial [Neisseriaceae bacterium]|nr:ComEC family DNA internalization-related competence protein [Neisseriaceae bacterium]